MMAPLAYSFHVERGNDMPRLRNDLAVVLPPVDHMVQRSSRQHAHD